jgi:hypothetical protein
MKPTFVHNLPQVALGLFVSTSDLPHLGQSDASATFDCSFDGPCRWQSSGGNADRWLLATGQPDPFLWLAATGSMQPPGTVMMIITVTFDGKLLFSR